MAHQVIGTAFNDHTPCLVVCASLVEKITNQAALCRTCEVLGVNRLVLPEPDDSWEFRKVAVSAQRWQSVEYCAPDQLRQWLWQQQTYTRVALALGVASQPLVNYDFAAKTLLVLGRELTGIPADIEALCDVVLAIPQYGRVESLNVQTAGAIAIYEYNRQWR
ncbi:rrna methylase family [Leptolyngbya sp. Heron Island J]|uniref:TrmH family RNA methyltransferase n=1 Tax=Leptolyngbya sp. Heron Island J TaxID=1385935 RepID=UPI0003B94E8A|nr:RNA methyltransferase [Leptolyngbya sp. Heron Island J]ESA37627.1 rrna methylase family [Leptolyngbya sp. Heron Island J]